MIRLNHLSYWYPGAEDPALHDLSLDIPGGQAVCVMGRNGSGKSTLVRLIAGLIKPGRGTLRVNGHVPGPQAGRSEVGILFQNPDNQMVATLVEKEIAFALENQAVEQAEMEAAVARVSRQFKIEHLLTRLTSELSGGEKQRVALASVMILNPAVLLLDEPDSFLDQAGRDVLAAELERVHAGNPELVEMRITQSAEVARKYSRLVVVDRGSVVADGRPGEILSDHSFCAQSGITVPDLSKVSLSLPGLPGAADRPSAGRVAEIELDDVSFAWPMSPPVFQGLSLRLRAGETVGLVGPTGVGKSSLAMLLCGLARPIQGQVRYRSPERVQIQPSDLKGQVALILQQPERQFFLDTCSDEIAFGPSNLGRPLSAGDINRLLEVVGLDPSRFAGRDPFSLSSGEKRRLAFAAVLAMGPSMVIFDEPTAGLDGEGTGRFISLSKRLRETGLGQLIISHDGNVMHYLADRILYLTAERELRELLPAELLGDTRYAGVVSNPTVIT